MTLTDRTRVPQNEPRPVRRFLFVLVAASVWAVGAWYSSAVPAARAATAMQGGPGTVLDGVYSAAQATRGESVYSQECSSCHGQNPAAGGSDAPPLAGPEFINEWSGQTVADLFDRIAASMPADGPGRLTKQQYADIVADILKANGFPAGNAELAADSSALKIAIKAK
jgi:mono/diheme cytochrome c family protein